MNIVFFCQSCGSRFEVDPRAAGKQGRCKQCGQRMTVPKAEQIASMAAMPALAVAGAGAGAGSGSASGWLARVGSQVGLAPITIDRMPAGYRKPSRFDEPPDDAKPYVLAKPERRQSSETGSRPAGAVVRVWRGQLGWVQKLFRKINEAAYLISIPFVMLLLLGAVIRNRPMALFGATVVVLLNIGRLVSGCANLAVIPLRDGFDFNKMKKPLRRIIEPAITIGLVILAFTFIPWLTFGDAADETIRERVGSSASALGREIEGKVGSAVGKVDLLDLEKLGDRAKSELGALKGRVRDKVSGTSNSGAGAGGPEQQDRGPANP